MRGYLIQACLCYIQVIAYKYHSSARYYFFPVLPGTFALHFLLRLLFFIFSLFLIVCLRLISIFWWKHLDRPSTQLRRNYLSLGSIGFILYLATYALLWAPLGGYCGLFLVCWSYLCIVIVAVVITAVAVIVIVVLLCNFI